MKRVYQVALLIVVVISIMSCIPEKKSPDYTEIAELLEKSRIHLEQEFPYGFNYPMIVEINLKYSLNSIRVKSKKGREIRMEAGPLTSLTNFMKVVHKEAKIPEYLITTEKDTSYNKYKVNGTPLTDMSVKLKDVMPEDGNYRLVISN